MKRSSFMILITHITILVSLLIFGVFLIVKLNLNYFSHVLNSSIEAKVFLKDGLTKKEIKQFQTVMLTFDGVKDVSLVSKKTSWEKMKSKYKSISFTDYFDENPLPNMFIVELHDQRLVKQVSNKIKTYDKYTEDVVYGGKFADKVIKLAIVTKIFGWVLVIILTFATLLIMINTIKLTVLNRTEEISIMKLVGASDMFIISPFIFEAIIIGLVSSVSGIFILNSGYAFLINQAETYMPFMSLVTSQRELFKIYTLMVTWGIGLTSIGTYLSIRGTLKKS